MQHRREIDGLRAIAVVPVILFHAGFGVFSGGFVGVDIFFVISGYLITGILLADLDAGAFSILRFYERRVRRILPALFFVMACCVPPALVWLLPWQLEDFAQSLLAVTLFASNMLFAIEADYFAPAAELKPLLHTWSLAVEEQFYVLFPPLLAGLWRLGRRWAFWLLVVCALASLALSVWGAERLPVFNFFYAPPRAWELLAGSICAFLAFGKVQKSNDLLAGAGLAMIVGSIFVFNESTPMPGLPGLIPVGGTALILLYGGGQNDGRPSRVAALLGKPLFSGIGLISYSAYLWHQPLLAFARIQAGGEPGVMLLAALIAATFGLAWLTWRYVEQPFRRGAGSLVPTRRGIFALAALCGLVFIALGANGMASYGLASRLTAEQRAILAYEKLPVMQQYREGTCFLKLDQTFADYDPACFSRQRAVLIGDSHAAALSYGLRQTLGAGQLNGSSCPPVLDFAKPKRPHCIGDNAYIFARIAKERPALVILHADWSQHAGDPLFWEKLAGTLRYLRGLDGVHVLVLGGVPQWRPTLPHLLVEAHTGLGAAASLPAQPNEVAATDRRLRAIAAAQGARFISLQDKLCAGGKCHAVIPAGNSFAPIAWDYGHLTPAGSLYVAGLLQPELSALAQ